MRLFMLGLCAAALAGGCANVQPTRTAQTDWTRQPVVVPFAKVYRGTKNIVLSPLDVPVTAYRKVRAAHGVVGTASAAVTGTAEGVVNGVSRLSAGAIEIISFPLVYQPDPLYQRKLGEPAFPPTPKKPPHHR